MRLLAAVLALAVLVGCGEDDDDQAAAAPPFTDVGWQLASGLDVPGWQRAAPTATFADGRLAGSTGCNRYTAPYTLEGDALAIGDVATTMIGCEADRQAVEQAFLAALDRVARVQATAGELALLDADGAELLRFRTPSLDGTWKLTAFLQGDAVSSPLTGSEITATFAAGEVTGSAGCNRYHGTYTSERGSIEIPRLAWTEKGCSRPQGVMEQEQAYLAALPQAASYSVEDDGLTLLTAAGTIVASFTRHER